MFFAAASTRDQSTSQQTESWVDGTASIPEKDYKYALACPVLVRSTQPSTSYVRQHSRQSSSESCCTDSDQVVVVPTQASDFAAMTKGKFTKFFLSL